MDNPLVSVIIPTYNGRQSLGQALDSVLVQTYQSMEIIVLNDASTDGVEAVILEYVKKDPRISYVKNEQNLGFVKSLNKAIGLARGKYIARLDDDDNWADVRKIEKQVDFLEKNPEYVLVGGGLIRVNTQRKELVRYLFLEHDEDIRRVILIDNMFAHSAVVFSRDAFLKVGGYDERFGFFADRDLWLKLGCMGKMHNFPEYFVYYLDKEDSMPHYHSRNNEIRRKLKLNILLRQKYKKNYPGFYKSLALCFASYLYSYLPYRQKLRRVMLVLRMCILGKPSYTYVKPQ